jgi:hypothetical protein
MFFREVFSNTPLSKGGPTLWFVNIISGWWFGACFFPHIFGIITPTDYIIFFRRVETTNQVLVLPFISHEKSPLMVKSPYYLTISPLCQ